MQDLSFLKNIKRNDLDFGDKKDFKEDDEDVVNEVMKQKLTKAEKKEQRRFMFRDSEQRLGKRASQVQKIIDVLHRKRLRQPGEIMGYFKAEKIQIGKIPLQMYTSLASVRVENSGKLHFSNSMLNGSIYFRAFAGNFVTKTMTNDVLYLYLLYNRILLGASGKEENNPVVKMLLNSDVAGAMISTKPFILEEEDIRKGYYQDFTADAAVIGTAGVDKSERAKIISKEKYKFKIKGVQYQAEGDSNMCVIVNTEKYGPDESLKLLEDVKVISEFGNFELGPKVVEVKNKCVRYISANLKPEVFCPAFLELNDEESFSVLLKMKIDLNSLFDLMEEQLKSKKDIFISNAFGYWDSFETYFEFLFVFLLTSPTLNKDENKEKKSNLKGYILKYIDLKPALIAWKQNQLALQKLCIDYYNSFLGRIKYDKIRSLYKRISSYIDARNKLLNESFSEVKGFIDSCPIFSMNVRRQLSMEGLSLGDDLYSAITAIYENNPDFLVKKLRRAGVLIYESGYYLKMDKDDKKLLFPFTLSEGAFLGNLYEGYQVENPIETNANRISKSIIERNTRYEEFTDKVFDVLQEADDKITAIVRKNVINQVGANTPDLIINYLVKEIKKNMSKNEKDKINKYLAKNLNKEANALDYTLNKNSMKPVNNYLSNQRMQKNTNKSNMYKEMNEIEKSKKKIEAIQEDVAGEGKGDGDDDIEMAEDEKEVEKVVAVEEPEIVEYLLSFKGSNKKNSGVSKLLADIIIDSKVYDLGTDDWNNLSAIPPGDLLRDYPIDREAIKYVLADHKIEVEPGEVENYVGSPYKPIGLKYTSEFAKARNEGYYQDQNLPSLKQKQEIIDTTTSRENRFTSSIGNEPTTESRYNFRSSTIGKSPSAGNLFTFKKGAQTSSLTGAAQKFSIQKSKGQSLSKTKSSKSISRKRGQKTTG